MTLVLDMINDKTMHKKRSFCRIRAVLVGFLLLGGLACRKDKPPIEAPPKSVAAAKAPSSWAPVGMFSPDERTFLLRRDSDLQLVDVETHHVKTTLRFPETEWISFASWSSDGSRIAESVDLPQSGAAVVLWNVATREIDAVLRAKPRMVDGQEKDDRMATAAFSPDRRFVVTANRGRPGYIWDVVRAAQIHALGPEGRAGLTAFYSPTGDRIVLCDEDGFVTIWSSDGKQLEQLGGPNEPMVFAVFSPDGNSLAITKREYVGVWDLQTKQWRWRKYMPHAKEISFSPNGSWLVTANEESKLFRLDTTTGNVLTTYDFSPYYPIGHFGIPVFSAHGKWLSGETHGGYGIDSYPLFDAMTQHVVHVFRNSEPEYLSGDLSADGKSLALLTSHREAEWRDATTGELKGFFPQQALFKRKVVFPAEPNNPALLFGTTDAYPWSGRQAKDSIPLPMKWWPHAISSQRTCGVSATLDKRGLLTGLLRHPEQTKVIPVSQEVTRNMAISSDCSLVAVIVEEPGKQTGDKGWLEVWNTHAVARLCSIPLELFYFDQLTFSADGTLLHVIHRERLYTWSVQTGRPVPYKLPPGFPTDHIEEMQIGVGGILVRTNDQIFFYSPQTKRSFQWTGSQGSFLGQDGKKLVILQPTQVKVVDAQDGHVLSTITGPAARQTAILDKSMPFP